jgi:hypothetical protein
MKPTPKPAKSPTEIQIDRIAKALPPEVQTDFYREMMYCRSLAENDEMLHILNILRMLSVVMVDVPTRVADERQRLEHDLRDTCMQLRENLSTSQAYHKEIAGRLAQLPKEIATGISPKTIAASINESLRQQFVASTIPETAKALAAMSAELREISTQFRTNASTLSDTYKGAANDARKAVTELHTSISEAARRAREATDQLAVTYAQAYRWSLYALTAGGFVVGMVLMLALLRMFFFS